MRVEEKVKAIAEAARGGRGGEASSTAHDGVTPCPRRPDAKQEG